MSHQGLPLLPRQSAQTVSPSPSATLLPPQPPPNLVPGTATGSSSPEYAAVLILCFIIGWAGVALRFFFRGTAFKALFRDDWLMLLAAFLYTTTGALRYLALSLAIGKRQNTFPIDNMVRAAKYYYVADLACTACILSVKVSFIMFYIRLVVKRWKAFQCWPIAAAWTRLNKVHGTCSPKMVFLIWAISRAIMGGITDWILGVVLPISLLRCVCKTKTAKLQLILLVLLGILAGVTSLVPLVYVPALARRIEWYWPSTPLGVWTNLEPGILLLAGGFADFRPLLIEGREKIVSLIISEQTSGVTSQETSSVVGQTAPQDSNKSDGQVSTLPPGGSK